MNEAISSDTFSPQTSSLVDAETQIKLTIQKGLLTGKSFIVLNIEIQKIITKALLKIKSDKLSKSAGVSLNKFATYLYNRLYSRLWNKGVLIAVMLILADKHAGDNLRTKALHTLKKTVPDVYREYSTDAKGIPLQEYAKDYIEKRVKSIYRELAQAKAVDKNDNRGRNILRNLAEMQVRYEAGQQEIAEFKAEGVKLVVCSMHADCSKRCFPWQGKIYSLDGSSGTTDDGKTYQPLENATNIPSAPTHSGKVYMNGLLGFNCRHKLYPYKSGMATPSVSAETQKREYAITKKQREYERKIVEARDNALIFGEVDLEYAKMQVQLAKKLMRDYKAFSLSHERAYYPDRTKLL